jgi:hypothetical protein
VRLAAEAVGAVEAEALAVEAEGSSVRAVDRTIHPPRRQMELSRPWGVKLKGRDTLRRLLMVQ